VFLTVLEQQKIVTNSEFNRVALPKANHEPNNIKHNYREQRHIDNIKVEACFKLAQAARDVKNWEVVFWTSWCTESYFGPSITK
jgi:hypothetical protein